MLRRGVGGGREAFGAVSLEERRQAELFFADLVGARRVARRRRRPWPAEAWAEDAPLVEGPLTEPEWRNVSLMLVRGEADVGVPLTGDADRNALLVAGKIFCDRNALNLGPGDPLRCLVADVTITDPRVRRLVPHVTARGSLVNWTIPSLDSRTLYVMRRLVQDYGYPVAGAAGLVGNLRTERASSPSGSRAPTTRSGPCARRTSRATPPTSPRRRS